MAFTRYTGRTEALLIIVVLSKRGLTDTSPINRHRDWSVTKAFFTPSEAFPSGTLEQVSARSL